MTDDRQQIQEVNVQAALALLDSTRTLVAIHDDHDRLVYANDAYRGAFYVAADEAVDWYDMMRDNFKHQRGPIIDSDDIESWLEYARTRRRREHYREFEVDLIDGRWIRMTETVLAGVGMLSIGIEVTAAKQTESSLKDQFGRALREAETDQLTGLGNRRLLERLERVILHDEHLHELSAIMIDIDHFKPYNDTLGHPEGDVCLQRVAEVLAESLRTEHDNAMRYGGEEFLVLLPGTSLAVANEVGERIRRTVEAQAIPHPTSEFGVITVSVGVAHVSTEAPECVNDVVSLADKALYVAKEAGRNRVEVGVVE
ncbi:GGDEF domain-containing protein [Salinispirillum sp. LH 10-3-1]|uniref:diguanylate cyclase n=1 Tax=Salinispirillum sp. LH 10-3-1 TaxID=2952525 RepID=A0AB38YGZ8_9GAMM